MKNHNIHTILTFLFLITLSFPNKIIATICNPLLSTNGSCRLDPTVYANDVLSTIISIFFIVGIIYFLWHIIFAGYHFISSEGDPKRYENAKNQITYAILGLVVIFSVFAIIKFVGIILGITGLENLTITWPTI